MAQPTGYQYAKLGGNLEFLRGTCTVSLMQTTSLAAFPNLMENLPPRRYSVMHVVEAMKAILIQLQELKLEQSLRTAEPFRPMLSEMEDYLSRTKEPQLAHLNDKFADRLVALSKVVASAVRSELGATVPLAPTRPQTLHRPTSDRAVFVGQPRLLGDEALTECASAVLAIFTRAALAHAKPVRLLVHFLEAGGGELRH